VFAYQQIAEEEYQNTTTPFHHHLVAQNAHYSSSSSASKAVSHSHDLIHPQDDGYLAAASVMTSPQRLTPAEIATSRIYDEGYLDYNASKSYDKNLLTMTSRE
jgi:hypothetical protein